MPLYSGVNGVNRKTKELHSGVAGVNRKIKELYGGVNGVNRKVFSSGLGIIDGTTQLVPLQVPSSGGQLFQYYIEQVAILDRSGFAVDHFTTNTEYQWRLISTLDKIDFSKYSEVEIEFSVTTDIDATKQVPINISSIEALASYYVEYPIATITHNLNPGVFGYITKTISLGSLTSTNGHLLLKMFNTDLGYAQIVITKLTLK